MTAVDFAVIDTTYRKRAEKAGTDKTAREYCTSALIDWLDSLQTGFDVMTELDRQALIVGMKYSGAVRDVLLCMALGIASGYMLDYERFIHDSLADNQRMRGIDEALIRRVFNDLTLLDNSVLELAIAMLADICELDNDYAAEPWACRAFLNVFAGDTGQAVLHSVHALTINPQCTLGALTVQMVGKVLVK